MDYKEYLKKESTYKNVLKRKYIKEEKKENNCKTPPEEQHINQEIKKKTVLYVNKKNQLNLNRNKDPIGWSGFILEGVKEFNPEPLSLDDVKRKDAREITKEELKDPVQHAGHLL